MVRPLEAGESGWCKHLHGPEPYLGKIFMNCCTIFDILAMPFPHCALMKIKLDKVWVLDYAFMFSFLTL